MKEIEAIPVRELIPKDLPPTPSEEIVFLLVYGSLRRGMSRHSILESPNVHYLDTIVLPNFTLLDLGYFPTIVASRNNVKGVVCEIYSLPRELLTQIDNLEGCPTFFTREVVPEMKNMYVYTMKMHEAFANKSKTIVWIHSGDYVEYINPPKNEPSIESLEED